MQVRWLPAVRMQCPPVNLIGSRRRRSGGDREITSDIRAGGGVVHDGLAAYDAGDEIRIDVDTAAATATFFKNGARVKQLTAAEVNTKPWDPAAAAFPEGWHFAAGGFGGGTKVQIIASSGGGGGDVAASPAVDSAAA